MPFIDYFQEREMEAEKRGEERGLERGEKLGVQRGEKLGLLEGIRVGLSVRLPEQEKTLMARAEKVDDLELLRNVLKAATAANVEELNRLLPRRKKGG